MEREEKKQPFRSDEGAVEDVANYARKLCALGDLIAAVCCAATRGRDEAGLSDSLVRVGEELGYIIQDYAQAIDIMCMPFFDINDREAITRFIVDEYKDTYEFIVTHKRPADLLVINTKLQELRELRHNVSMPIIDLTNKFEDLAKEITEKRENIRPAAAAAASG